MNTSHDVAAAPPPDAAVIKASWHEPERFAEIFHRYFSEIHRYIARRLGTRTGRSGRQPVRRRPRPGTPVRNGPPLSADMGTPRPPGRAVLETRTSKKAPEYYLGPWCTSAQLQSLPADPGKLRALLSRNSGEKQVTDERLFDLSINLVMSSPITPQVRAAVFRMLAGLKTVRSIGSVQDAMGRNGQGVGINITAPTGGVSEMRFIFDPKSGAALAIEDIVIKPGRSYPGGAQGHWA
jgi:hypothetical protein